MSRLSQALSFAALTDCAAAFRQLNKRLAEEPESFAGEGFDREEAGHVVAYVGNLMEARDKARAELDRSRLLLLEEMTREVAEQLETARRKMQRLEQLAEHYVDEGMDVGDWESLAGALKALEDVRREAARARSAVADAIRDAAHKAARQESGG